MSEEKDLRALIPEVQRHYPAHVRTEPAQATEQTARNDQALARSNDAANHEITRLQEQAHQLLEQAERVSHESGIRKKIREAQCGFDPKVGQSYFLYEREQQCVLTLISPDEWSGPAPYGAFLAEVRQLPDFTWEVSSTPLGGSDGPRPE